ncbi:MAG: hypothetical protein BGO13_10935 [Burkholderiales bacterium 66-5]|nr:MAG: hypothetical protein BGO13_10935 [Burkholderiales bacterium 66-5]
MENVENLLLEHLKRFQASQDRIERKLEEVITRTGHIEIGLAGLRRDLAHADEGTAGTGVRVDRLTERIERIERRLEIEG